MASFRAYPPREGPSAAPLSTSRAFVSRDFAFPGDGAQTPSSASLALRRWRRLQGRYFADKSQALPEGLWAAAKAEELRRRGRCTPRVCLACFCEGHVMAECPTREVKCFSCGRGGHSVEGCPLHRLSVSLHAALRRQSAAESAQAEAPSSAFAKTSPATPGPIHCLLCGGRGHANCAVFSAKSKTLLRCVVCGFGGHTAAHCELRHSQYRKGEPSFKGSDDAKQEPRPKPARCLVSEQPKIQTDRHQPQHPSPSGKQGGAWKRPRETHSTFEAE